MKFDWRTILLAGAIAISGAIAHLATFGHVQGLANSPAFAAIVLTWYGCLPPLWFSSWIRNDSARPLVVVLWRFSILIPALWMAKSWEGLERNCFLHALLACYLVALPLESWLLIRDVQRSDSKE